jgi:hypothetical protein
MRRTHSSAAVSARRRALSGHQHSLRYKLTGSAIVLVLVSIIAELGARQLGPELPFLRSSGARSEMMVGHPTRLWTMSEGVKNNAGALATVHPTGLRGEVPQAARGPGEQRVVILGDSSFFGHGLADSETLSVQLSDRWDSLSPPVSVINGAMLGYSSEQAMLLMEDEIWGLEPTLLLIGLLWSDNTWDVFSDQDLIRTARAFSGNPLAKSLFFQLVAGAVDRLRGGSGARIITWTRKSRWPEHGVRRVSLRRYAHNLDLLARQAASRGAGVLFIAPGNRDTVASKTGEPSDSWEGYFDAMGQVAAHHHSPVVQVKDVLGPLLEADPSLDLDDLFIDEMHPTALSNAHISASIARTLEQRGWPLESLVAGSSTPVDLSTLKPDRNPQRVIETRFVSPHMRMFPTQSR